MNSQGKTLSIRTALLIAYGFIGAGIFTAIEKQQERNSAISVRRLDELKRNFTKNYNITDEEFNHFTINAYEATRVGLLPDWSYFRAVDFAYTALTTIGYGHLTPVTTTGKLFCVVFCLFGIPMCLLVLKTAGELISKALTNVIVRIEKNVFCRQSVEHVELKCAIFSFIVMVTYISLCSLIQVLWEKWTFSDAFYAWFVAYTTVGFGDYIPFDDVISRDDEHGVLMACFHVFSTIPALFGLCIVASVLNGLLKVFENNEAYFSRDKRCCMGKARKETEGGTLPLDSRDAKKNCTGPEIATVRYRDTKSSINQHPLSNLDF